MSWNWNMRNSTWRCIAILPVGALLGLFLSESALAHENHAPLPTKGVTVAGDTIMLSEPARESIGLTTAKVQLGDIHRTVTVNAQVKLPWHAQAMITSLVPGRIEKTLVRPGETVVAGQELARVASTDLQSLQIELLQAKSKAALAEKMVRRRTSLANQGVIAGKSLSEAESQFSEASAALHIARQKLVAVGIGEASIKRIEENGEPYSYISVVSPIAGVITHADVRIGQTVESTDHLYHVVNPTRAWIVGDALESDVRLLKFDQAVTAEFAALPGVKFSGKIDHMGFVMDPKRRTRTVTIVAANERMQLRPGMFGRVRISVEAAPNAIVCPTDAVMRSRRGNYALVQRMPGKYENRAVQLGMSERNRVEVLDGLFPGDRVVVVGNSLLAAMLGNAHKARVEPTETIRGPHKHEGTIAEAHGAVAVPTDRQALVTPPIEGRIRRILVEPTQLVKEGQVLAEIESLQLRTAQLDFLQTLTRKRLVESRLTQITGLGDNGLVAKSTLWDLEGMLQTLTLEAGAIEKRLAYLGLEPEAIAKLKQADLTADDSLAELASTIAIRAPKAGRLVRFNVVPGQVVHPGDELFEIHGLSVVWVKAYVYESDVAQVTLGQSAHVHFAAYPRLQANGKVVRISPLLEDKMRVLPVWIEVANPDELLIDGMPARMTIMDESAADGEHQETAQLEPVDTLR